MERDTGISRWVLVAPVVVVVMVVLVLALDLVPLTPKLYVECEEVNTPSPDLEPPVSQIIITGPEDVVPKVLEDAGVQPKPLRICSVGYKGLGTPRVGSLPFSPGELHHLSMGLYELDQDLEDTLEKIKVAGRDKNVYVHPNYLVGLLGQSSCGKPDESAGSPWEVVGSPWEVVGSPWEVVGSPWEVVGSPGGLPLPAEEAAELFWNQWAFQQIGAGTFLTHAQESTLSPAAGAAVRVAVLDTSPFSEPAGLGTAAEGEWVAGSQQQTDWWTQNQSCTDTGLDVTPLFSRLPELTPADPAPPDLRDHGLFVASLIHAVAPESDIQLYRVLDEHGCGQVFAVSEAILDFAERVQADARRLDGAVINLSLGVHKPRTAVQENVPSSAADAVTQEAKDQIISLRSAVAFATERQIVIVAAAGNDSYLASEDGLVLSPHYPAQYPSVIGVSASNALRQRSCFSNWGDIAAPGGDGGPGSILVEQNSGLLDVRSELEKLDCVPLSSTCAGDCSQALIGLVRDPGTEGEGCGYVYWQGTSFSAPLVSGAAALLLDAGAHSCSAKRVWLSPDQVFDGLRCGAPTPDGVINVPASLYRCLP